MNGGLTDILVQENSEVFIKFVKKHIRLEKIVDML